MTVEYRHADGSLCDHGFEYIPRGASLACQGRAWRIKHGPPDDPVRRLRDKRLAMWRQCKKLADDAAGQDRRFTNAEQQHWDALLSALEDLDRQLAAMLGQAGTRNGFPWTGRGARVST